MKYRVANTKKLDRMAIAGNAGLLYRSVVGSLDSVLKGSKPSRKTSKRHEKALRAVRKFLKQASDGQLEAKAEKPKKSEKSKTKSKDKKKAGKETKASKKAKSKNKKIKRAKKSKPIDPLLLTGDDNNVVPLRSPEKLLGAYDTDKASDIMSLTPQPDIALTNSLDQPNGEKDDLKMIAGVGPKLEELLNGLGIFHFQQIAEWDRKDIDWVDNYLQFTGRIDRDNWVEQAIALAKGGRDEYVKVFGKEPR